MRFNFTNQPNLHKLVAFCAGLILFGFSVEPASAQSGPPPGFYNELLMSGLNEPVAIEFLPAGEMLIAERAGAVWLAQPPYRQLPDEPVIQLFNLEVTAYDGGQGVLNLVTDPQFAENGYFYLFYTAKFPARHRISRFTFDAATGKASLLSEQVIWQDNVTRNQWHFGSAMAFGSDGYFYFTTGDNNAPNTSNLHVSQDPTHSWGKLMRIRLLPAGTGPSWHPYYTVPLDNPYWDGTGPNYDEIYAMGLRNPFRMSFTPEGKLLIGDVGGNITETAWEEVNLVAAGANYGWPLCEGSICQTGVDDITAPIFAYSHEHPPGSGHYEDASITGGLVYTGDQFPEAYKGAYFYGDYAQRNIRYITFDESGMVSGDHPFDPAGGGHGNTGVGEVVDLKLGPDGAIYYVDIGIPWGMTENPFAGAVRRLVYNTTGNEPPQVSITASVTEGPAPLQVVFSSVATDADDEPLTYSWDLGNGETATAASHSYTYSENGIYFVKLAVSDGQHTVYGGPLVLKVGYPPTVTVSQPISGTQFRAGDTITLRGTGSDRDGQLPLANYAWRVLLHHGGHVHPFLGPLCCRLNTTFQVAPSGHGWGKDTWYEVLLQVTDADGLLSQDSVAIYPDLVDLHFETIPSGLEIRLDELTAIAPFHRDSLIGFQHAVAATPQQTVDDIVYQFVAWSNGEAASHTLTSPETNATYLALYDQACPAELLLAAQDRNQEMLGHLRRLRDEVMTGTVTGEHYRQLYETHRRAVVTVLWQDAMLRKQGADLLATFLPGLTMLVNDGGEDVIVSVQMIAELQTFLAALSARAFDLGEPDLSAAIEAETLQIDWAALSARSFAAAWHRLQGEAAPPAVYLPSLFSE